MHNSQTLANGSWRHDYASDHVGVLIMANTLELKSTVYSVIVNHRARRARMALIIIYRLSTRFYIDYYAATKIISECLEINGLNFNSRNTFFDKFRLKFLLEVWLKLKIRLLSFFYLLLTLYSFINYFNNISIA